MDLKIALKNAVGHTSDPSYRNEILYHDEGLHLTVGDFRLRTGTTSKGAFKIIEFMSNFSKFQTFKNKDLLTPSESGAKA